MIRVLKLLSKKEFGHADEERTEVHVDLHTIESARPDKENLEVKEDKIPRKIVAPLEAVSLEAENPEIGRSPSVPAGPPKAPRPKNQPKAFQRQHTSPNLGPRPANQRKAIRRQSTNPGLGPSPPSEPRPKGQPKVAPLVDQNDTLIVRLQKLKSQSKIDVNKANLGSKISHLQTIHKQGPNKQSSKEDPVPPVSVDKDISLKARLLQLRKQKELELAHQEPAKKPIEPVQKPIEPTEPKHSSNIPKQNKPKEVEQKEEKSPEIHEDQESKSSPKAPKVEPVKKPVEQSIPKNPNKVENTPKKHKEKSNSVVHTEPQPAKKPLSSPERKKLEILSKTDLPAITKEEMQNLPLMERLKYRLKSEHGNTEQVDKVMIRHQKTLSQIKEHDLASLKPHARLEKILQPPPDEAPPGLPAPVEAPPDIPRPADLSVINSPKRPPPKNLTNIPTPDLPSPGAHVPSAVAVAPEPEQKSSPSFLSDIQNLSGASKVKPKKKKKTKSKKKKFHTLKSVRPSRNSVDEALNEKEAELNKLKLKNDLLEQKLNSEKKDSKSEQQKKDKKDKKENDKDTPDNLTVIYKEPKGPEIVEPKQKQFQKKEGSDYVIQKISSRSDLLKKSKPVKTPFDLASPDIYHADQVRKKNHFGPYLVRFYQRSATIRTQLIEPTWENLRDDNSCLLDSGYHLYRWDGHSSSTFAKIQCRTLMDKICEARHGLPKKTVLDGLESHGKFWKRLGWNSESPPEALNVGPVSQLGP